MIHPDVDPLRSGRVRRALAGGGAAPYTPLLSMAVVVVLALVALAACDTNDGTTLSTPDPALITTAPPTTLDPTASTAEQMLPGDDAAAIDDPLSDEPLNSVAITEPPAATGDGAADTATGPFEIIGPWVDGAPIDPLHTCDGADVSPAISWVGVPDGTAELAFVMVDDTTEERGQPAFVHWVLAGVDPADVTLLEGETPLGGILGINFFGNTAYNGPCPPPDDDPHEYRIVAYALNQQTELADGTPATEFISFLDDVAIGTTDLIGTYGR